MDYGYEITVETDYNGIGKLQYILGQKNIPIEASEYTEKVTIQFHVAYDEKDFMIREMNEATAGKARLTVSEPVYYKIKKATDT
jgi:putative IMPACT (imprinted ancient) family translation regulator